MKSFENRARIYMAAIFICSLIITGCSPAPIFIKSDYDQKQIKTIAVMPVVDKRTTVNEEVQSHKDLSNIEDLLSKKIIEKNYDVLSPVSVKDIITEKALENMSPANLCAALKVDGILYSELSDYTDQFFIHHSLKMGFKIFDAKGDSLWINNVDDSDRPWLSAISASLGWAIGVAVYNDVSPKNKVPTILAGVAAAEVVYGVVDALLNETSQSIDGVFHSLPEKKGNKK